MKRTKISSGTYPYLSHAKARVYVMNKHLSLLANGIVRQVDHNIKANDLKSATTTFATSPHS